jgi:NAD(P)-dependent dehydrogenase (short-subunit alcohol dehydrogenase family)
MTEPPKVGAAVTSHAGTSAFLTGAASGIGRATALRLAREGYVVGLFDLDPDGLESTRQQVAEVGGTTVTLTGDVTDSDAVGRAMTKLSTVAPLALACNIAGVGVAAAITDTTDEQWQRVLSVNLTGTFVVCRAAVPRLIANGGGVIVNVASVGGLVGLGNRAAYCASKAGVIGLTRALAVDHARDGIRVVAMCPGTVQTEWIDKIIANDPDPDATRRAMGERQLDGRMGTPDEVAAGIAFVASADGRFMNGCEFVMDGGLTAR